MIFTAKKDNSDVLVEWKTAYEKNIGHFEIEVAKSTADYQNGIFVKIGEVVSPGASNSERSYSFTDVEPGKIDTRYYRLKIVNNDNSFIYTPVRSVVFDDDIEWKVYPNPSNGNFELKYIAEPGRALELKIFDVSGKLVKKLSATGTGIIQRIPIDLRSIRYAPGVYLLLAESGEKKYDARLIKQ